VRQERALEMFDRGPRTWITCEYRETNNGRLAIKHEWDRVT
jgi:hypothetical protein